MKIQMKLILLSLTGILLLGFTSGCKSTAHGAGKDIEKIGEKIQDKTN